jgi:small subunit ribosomal protein S10
MTKTKKQKKLIKVRIKLKGYDHRIMDISVSKIVDTAIRTGAKVVGPVPLPTKIERFTVIRGPTIDKRSREQFELRTHKRLIDIGEVTEDLLNKVVNVTGTSKGKGFTGVMKKWNFAGGQATRGQKHGLRAPGSIGAQTPSKVFKGKKMAGRHGNYKITLKNKSIVAIDVENSHLYISGPVPGARNSKVQVVFEEE